MPNYEELYYIARNKYNQAVEDRNSLRKNIAELQGRKDTLNRELGEKQATLLAVQQKKVLIQEALKKCDKIIENEYPAMKRDLQSTSDEYKKIIISDKGVADLFSIYSGDIESTYSNLESVSSEFKRFLNDFEQQEKNAQAAVTNCANELNNVKNSLNNAGNESQIQRQINNYFTEMKEYESRWLNGE